MAVEDFGKIARDGGVLTTFVGWLTVEKTCAIVGLIVAIAGYLLQRRATLIRLEREEERAALETRLRLEEVEREKAEHILRIEAQRIELEKIRGEK